MACGGTDAITLGVVTTTNPCPICQKPVPIPTGTDLPDAYPFCCKRCRLIDLGRWADGAYVVPGRSVVDIDELEPPPDRL